MKIDDKGAEISIKILREVRFGDKYGQRRSNIEECERIKNSWTREAHK
jgi:phage-related protein